METKKKMPLGVLICIILSIISFIGIFVITIGMTGFFLESCVFLEPDSINIDGGDLTFLSQIFGSVTAVYTLFFGLYAILFAMAIIWGTYGFIVLMRWLWKNHRKVFWGVLCTIVAAIAVMAVLVNMKSIKLLTNPPAEGTVASLSYEYMFDEPENDKCRIYIEEYGKLTPYLVIDHKFKGDKALLLRENVLGTDETLKDEYSEYYSGEMNYIDAEHYIENEFSERFDEKLLSVIPTVTVDREYRDSSETKFFMVPAELFSGFTFDDNRNDNLRFFDDYDRRLAVNDEGKKCVWFAEYNGDIHMVNLLGGITTADTQKYGVRPAFCISSETEIKKIQGKNGEEISVLDLD